MSAVEVIELVLSVCAWRLSVLSCQNHWTYKPKIYILYSKVPLTSIEYGKRTEDYGKREVHQCSGVLCC